VRGRCPVRVSAAGGERATPDADGVDEAGTPAGGECAEEFFDWPGLVEVGGLLFERGLYGLGVEVVEVEDEGSSAPRRGPNDFPLKYDIRVW